MKKFTVILLCLCIITIPVYAVNIEDEFINSTLDKNLKIKTHKYTPIEDSFAQNNNNKNPDKKVIIFDEILPISTGKNYIKKPVILDENYKEIRIKILKPYSTKFALDEGDTIEFVTLDDVYINNKQYPKNSKVEARLETISKNKTYGVPSNVVISNFSLDNNMLAGEISKTGANRSLWLYPIVCAGSLFFGAGILLTPIRGGHAKIKPSEVFTIYSY